MFAAIHTGPAVVLYFNIRMIAVVPVVTSGTMINQPINSTFRWLFVGAAVGLMAIAALQDGALTQNAASGDKDAASGNAMLAGDDTLAADDKPASDDDFLDMDIEQLRKTTVTVSSFDAEVTSVNKQESTVGRNLLDNHYPEWGIEDYGYLPTKFAAPFMRG